MSTKRHKTVLRQGGKFFTDAFRTIADKVILTPVKQFQPDETQSVPMGKARHSFCLSVKTHTRSLFRAAYGVAMLMLLLVAPLTPSAAQTNNDMALNSSVAQTVNGILSYSRWPPGEVTSNTLRLTPQDQFAIGNRWTVRGFDGERTLNADRGWFVRNDIAWATPVPAQELYLGVDYGEVGGNGTQYLVGNHLAGGAIGIRGSAFKTGYDLFAAVPFSKPDGFKTDPVSLGFNLNWQY